MLEQGKRGMDPQDVPHLFNCTAHHTTLTPDNLWNRSGNTIRELSFLYPWNNDGDGLRVFFSSSVLFLMLFMLILSMTMFFVLWLIVICEWVGGSLFVIGCCVVCAWCCYVLCVCVNGASPVRFVLSLFYLYVKYLIHMIYIRTIKMCLLCRITTYTYVSPSTTRSSVSSASYALICMYIFIK